MTWWNSSWTKKKAITLTGGASGAQSAYQVKLTVTYDSDMKSDFSDLRFTNAAENALLDAWMESHTASTSAVIWVETNTPANNVDADIYMYYGNSGAASDWDIGATFLFGDDFPGSSIDTTKWDGKTSNASVSGGIMSYGGDNTADYLRSITQFGTDVACRSKIKFLSTASYLNYFGFVDPATNHRGRIYRTYSGNNRFQNKDGTTQTEINTNVPIDAWFVSDIKIIGGTSAAWFFDDVQGSGSPNTVNVANTSALELHFVGRAASTCIQSEWAIVCKYAANPPTYAFGSEQSVPTGNPYWYYNLLKRRN